MINLIAAVDLNSAIGYKNQLLTRLPNDMKHFRELTEGHFVVFGRKTFESIGKILPNRQNIIVTHDMNYNVYGAYVYNSLKNVIFEYKSYNNNKDELFICGGSGIYNQALPYADRIYLTVIDHKFENSDVYFPKFDLSEWKITENIKNPSDEKNLYDHYFITYERKNNNK